MGLKANFSERTASTFKPVPPGLHLARLYRIIDKGTHKTVWQGIEKDQQKIMLQFEVHGEDHEGRPTITDKGEPMTISKNLTNSMFSNSNMRKLMESWLGNKKMTDEEAKHFNIKDMLGEWGMILVKHTTKDDGAVFSNIDDIVPVSPIQRRHMPTPHNELKVFDFDDPDMEFFETLGPKLKEAMMQTKEWRQLTQRNAAPRAPVKPVQKKESSGFEDMEDNIPF